MDVAIKQKGVAKMPDEFDGMYYQLFGPLAEKYIKQGGFISEDTKDQIAELLSDYDFEKCLYVLASILEDAVDEALTYDKN